MASGFELEGKVKVIMEAQTFASGFSKREFVVEVEDGKFPQMIKFECIKDRAAQLENLAVGDPVKVNFDVRGNEYNDRYYVNLNAWKVAKLDGSSPPSGGGGGSGGATPEEGPPKGANDAYFDDQPDADDDIPF
jgi:single-strand DNA-binding protein